MKKDFNIDDCSTQKFLSDEYGISPKVVELVDLVLDDVDVKHAFKKIEDIAEYNHYKVLAAFHKNRISEVDLTGTTGYGYSDKGRDDLDRVYCDIFHTEDAIVRSQIVSGTHALATCLFGILRPGDELVAITGKPYDTMEEVIGIRGNLDNGSLKDFGVVYKQVDLKDDNEFDFDAIEKNVSSDTKMVLIQRSRGYEFRNAIAIDAIREVIEFIKTINNDIIVFVDNCYGEFVLKNEPTDVGADLIAGSLIKNPGGGIARTGGYIAGKKDLVDKCAARLTSPGIGREVGTSLDSNRTMYQGLFMAPHTVSESLKGAILCAALMERFGFETSPSVTDSRSDIVQAIKFKDRDVLISFCQGIQKAAPIDSYVTPEPWPMPGYDSDVIMAAGTFVQGATSELSADGPCKPPYIAYMQGGLVFEHVKLALMIVVNNMLNENKLELK